MAKHSAVEHWLGRLNLEKAPEGGTWAELIRRRATVERGEGSDRPLERLPMPEELARQSAGVREEVLYRTAYAGYLEREHRQIEKLRHLEQIQIPSGFDYLAVRGLRKEGATKLAALKPISLAQASRVSGVTPADISVLMVALGRRG